MRKLVSALSVGLLLLAGTTSASPPPPSFALEASCSSATDIVVTNTVGRVIECWRGELRPGETVWFGPDRIPPIDTLELRFRSAPPVNAWYQNQPLPVLRAASFCDAQNLLARPLPFNRPTEDQRRLVLFLQKDPDPLSETQPIWMPAVRNYWGESNFACSTAWVENGRVVAVRSAERWAEIGPVAANLKSFKEEVMSLPGPLKSLESTWK